MVFTHLSSKHHCSGEKEDQPDLGCTSMPVLSGTEGGQGHEGMVPTAPWANSAFAQQKANVALHLSSRDTFLLPMVDNALFTASSSSETQSKKRHVSEDLSGC